MQGVRTLYKQWLKETNRGGSVITGKSMSEFFDWLERIEQPKTFKVSVYTPMLLSNGFEYRKWFEDIKMYIEKNGVTITLDSEEVLQVLKSMPINSQQFY